jgi:hypothetical protein
MVGSGNKDSVFPLRQELNSYILCLHEIGAPGDPMADAVRVRLFVSEVRVRLITSRSLYFWSTKWHFGLLPVSFVL